MPYSLRNNGEHSGADRKRSCLAFGRDLQGRRAVILGMSSEGTYQKILTKVPLAEMNRYSTALSSITSGRATYGMKFSEYTQVPGDVQTQLLKAYEEQEKDEE